MIIVEIIFSKMTRMNGQRTESSLSTILILLTLSAALVAVTSKMIDSFYDPKHDPCLLNELCEWEYQLETINMEHWNICEI